MPETEMNPSECSILPYASIGFCSEMGEKARDYMLSFSMMRNERQKK